MWELAAPDQQIAFPMARGRRGPRPSRDARESTPRRQSTSRVRGRVLRASVGAPLAQVRHQRLLEHAAALYKEAEINRFVRYLHFRICRIRVSEPAGDLLWRPLSASFAATASRNAGRVAKRQTFGRRLRAHARVSATDARYWRRPPCRRTSRLTVDAARPEPRLTARIDAPFAKPREISSRSAPVSDNRERRRGGGGTPPAPATT